MYLAVKPKKAVLSDSNKGLIDFLRIVRKQPEAVVRSVWRFSNDCDCYYRVRDSHPRSEVGAAAKFLFLNRTCWGGIYRLNRRGEFNVPFGNSGRPICKLSNVVTASKAFNAARLACSDFEAVTEMAGLGDVVYADPPYTTRGAGNGFVRYNERIFQWKDQLRLASAAKLAAERGAFVAVSGLNHFEFLDLYSGWWRAIFPRSSTVGREVTSRVTIKEAVVFSRFPSSEALLAGFDLKQIQ